MKFSYQWLKELLPGLKERPKKLAHTLTLAGLEVESVEEQGKGLEKVVVGQVKSVAKHPNADRLSVCEVSDGKEVHSIVCGAPNVSPGKKYPLALEGAELPNGLILKRVKIRGVESRGMLCSAKELGLSEEVEGILELPDNAPVGRSFASYYQLNDSILDVANPPNRGDCLSHIGLAREIGAIHPPHFKDLRSHLIKGTYSIKDYVKVQVKDSRGCPRYCSRVIRGIKISPSPKWMVSRLESLGVRSINNVVDATNYVMLETGHPLHAFDHRFLRGGKLIIRKAGQAQKFETLDDEKRDLVAEDLVIADVEGVVALAGIMGGKNSEVQEDTSVLVLEAAAFNPVRIRQTARRLGLQSESSYRFERVVNPDTVSFALNRLTQLILELAGGEASREVIDLYPKKVKPVRLTLREARLEHILGIKIKQAEVKRILTSLGFKPVRSASGWRLTIPLYRNDITREIDVIEEVVRLSGYDQIKPELPRSIMRPARQSEQGKLEESVRNFLLNHGFYETIHYSFCGPEDLQKGGYSGDAVRLANPLSREMSLLRPALLPALLETYAKNRSSSEEGLRFFELRQIYFPPQGEQKRLAGIYGGPFYSTNWIEKGRLMDFFDGKGLLEAFFNFAKLASVSFVPTDERPEFHPGQCMRIDSNKKTLGYFGKLHPAILGKADLKDSVFYFDLDYSLLVQEWGAQGLRYEILSPYPRVTRDMALVMNEEMTHEEILKAVAELNVSWLKEVSLFDLYKGDKLPPGKKSLAFALVYENVERTLTDEEVNEVHFKLIDSLKNKLGVELR